MPKRKAGRWLQERRAALFRAEPLCRHCQAQGRVTAATIRDHIKPLAEGGRDEDANIQPLCQACSDIKTQAESRRGRGVQKVSPTPAETDTETGFLCVGVLRGGG